MNVRSNLSLDSIAAGLDAGRRSALEVVRHLAEEEGVRVFLVGGPVRDALLGMPVLDLDFSVAGDATAFASSLRDRLDGRLTVHPQFNTATVNSQGVRVDLVTARSETYRNPGALPIVKPGSIGDDLVRRDFTINAMALPVSPEGTSVLDSSGGLDDLQRGVIKILHGRSFVDDPTRMLRAVRYEQRFGFRIDSGTMISLAAVRDAGLMESVSGDRWRHELERILKEERPGPPLLRAMELGLLEGIHPALSKGDGLRRLATQPPEFVKPHDWLASLFASLSEAEGEGVIEKFRLPSSRADIARDTILLRNSEGAISDTGSASELVRMLSGVRPKAVSAWAMLTENPRVAAALGQFPEKLRCAKTALSGRELLAMGVPEGPAVGTILGRIREARLDGLVNGEEEERALALSLLSECQAALRGRDDGRVTY